MVVAVVSVSSVVVAVEGCETGSSVSVTVVEGVSRRELLRGASSSTTVRRSAGGRNPPRSRSLTSTSSYSVSQAPSTNIESSPRPDKESRFI